MCLKRSPKMISVEPPAKPRTLKRKRIFNANVAMKLTNFFIKKFREMILLEADCDSLPLKKRRIADHSAKENLLVDDDIPACIIDGLANVSLNSDKFMQDAFIIEPLSLQMPDLSKPNCLKRFKVNKKVLEIKNRTFTKTYNKKSRIKRNVAFNNHLTSIPFQNLLNRFENCVNFVRLSRLQSNIDMDNIVRSFSTFGKVLRIQDHWVQPRGSLNQHPTVWSGASVKYKHVEDMHRTLKAFSLEKTPILCISLVEHLFQIRSEEFKYMSLRDNSQSEGTSIIVENIGVRAHSKMRSELDCYGTILNIQWNRLKGNKYGCEVCYKSTTDAVAAALALDGKCVQRSVLRTKIKMRSKEMFIHRKLCENF